jgi:hypothetical protein
VPSEIFEIGANHGRITAHELGRAVGYPLAVIQDHNVVGDFHHDFHVVLDQQYADLVPVADESKQLVEFH